MRTATVTIDPAALSHNLQEVKNRAPKSQVLAMVKADAYGHGMATALPALADADGIGVATFEEALTARQLGWQKVITLIEGVFCFNEWQRALDEDCCCVIHHKAQLDWALKLQPKLESQSRTVWLKFNTGMNRLGFEQDEIIDVAKALHQAGYKIVLTTHFANADVAEHPLNQRQIARFSNMLDTLKQEVSLDIQGSLCNSAGIVNFAPYHFDWVRPGIILYGCSPVMDKSAAELNLKPAMSFAAKIMALHEVKAGDAIGYGSRWIAQKPTTTALVSIGYGDGYPRTVNDDAFVCVHNLFDNKNYFCPIIGRVAMDMMVIDVSQTAPIAIGSTVTLWGNAPHIDEVAAFSGTISYELLCRLSLRPTRLTAAS